nr:amino acid--tRNA ligase-related protein [Mycoplasmopsis bovis]
MKKFTHLPLLFVLNTQTLKKHLAEFWMIEPEIAFYDLKKVINFATKLLKNVIKNTIKKHPKEFDYLQNNVDETLLERLNTFIKKKLMVLDYKDALVELEKVKDRFENQDINFGLDFATEHEKIFGWRNSSRTNCNN